MQSADLEKGIRLKSANGAMIQFQICRVFCICNCLRVDLAFRDAKRMDWVLIVLRHTHLQPDTLAHFFRVCSYGSAVGSNGFKLHMHT